MAEATDDFPPRLDQADIPASSRTAELDALLRAVFPFRQQQGRRHHSPPPLRMDGRPSGKLLPRSAGPIAAYLLAHPDASRADVLSFIKQTFGVQVSRIALYKFLKKYGLQDVGQPTQATAQANPAVDMAP